MSTDIAIYGSGFYSIQAESARGRRFMRRVEGSDPAGVAYCDDTRLTQAIADGAVEQGLRVTVNSQPYEPLPAAVRSAIDAR